MANKYKEILIKPIIAENPITLQILGICSALAVTSNLTVTLIMCVATHMISVTVRLLVTASAEQIPKI